MRKIFAIVSSLLLCGAVLAPVSFAAPEKGVCIVCAVKHGETEAEPVKAVRTYKGKTYGFCSEKCAKEFDAEPAAYLPPELPRTAPTFALTTLAGKPVSSESLLGQVVLVDFWATWCMPCRKSMPELEALHKKNAKRGLTVLGISIDEGGSAPVKKFISSKKFTYPIALDSEKDPAWEAYRVKSVPAAFLIDRKGNLVAQWTGAAPDPKELEARIEKLLAAD